MSGENKPLDESQVEDYAAEAFERAMSFGISRDDFTRLAKRVWREMRAHPAPSEPSDIADAARVMAWARDPKRKPAQQAFTAGAERQAAYWIEWAWSEPAEIRREALREAVRICVGVRAHHTQQAARTDFPTQPEWPRLHAAIAEGADACAKAITREINASLPAQPNEEY